MRVRKLLAKEKVSSRGGSLLGEKAGVFSCRSPHLSFGDGEDPSDRLFGADRKNNFLTDQSRGDGNSVKIGF